MLNLKLNYYAHTMLQSRYKIYYTLFLYIFLIICLNSANLIHCMTENEDTLIQTLSEMEEQSKDSIYTKTDTISTSLNLNKSSFCLNCQSNKDQADAYKLLYNQLNFELNNEKEYFDHKLANLEHEIIELQRKNINLQRYVGNTRQLMEGLSFLDIENHNQEIDDMYEHLESFRKKGGIDPVIFQHQIYEPLKDAINDVKRAMDAIQSITYKNQNRPAYNFDIEKKEELIHKFKEDLNLVADIPKPLLIKSKSDTDLACYFSPKMKQQIIDKQTVQLEEQKIQITELQSRVNAYDEGYNLGAVDIRKQLSSIETDARRGLAILSSEVESLRKNNTQNLQEIRQLNEQIKTILDNL